MEAKLQFLPVDSEAPAKALYGMGNIQVFIEVLPDLLDQLCVSSFHCEDRFKWTITKPKFLIFPA
jgi:hypothetical protein